jgi:hypothetical protein
MKRLAQTASVMSLMAAVATGQARADVMLSGTDANDGSYSTAALAAMATGADTVSAGGLTGISLWGFLGGANSASPTSPTYGAITTTAPAGDNGKNAILRYYLVGGNGAGQNSVVSLGEIDPSFGGTAAEPAFVAFERTGGGLLATPELIVPGGAGRDIGTLTSLRLLAAPAAPNGPGGGSSAVQLTGNVRHPGSYTKAALQGGFTPITEVISGDTYTGVPLWTFLNAAGSATDEFVVTQGTEGYEVVLSLAELDPALGGNPNDLLPYADTGTDFPGDGVARTIFPTDNKHGRWESNLDFVDVSSVPEPGSVTLFGLALAAVAAVRFRHSAGIG